MTLGRLLLSRVIFSTVVTLAVAQTQPNLEIGFKPYGSHQGSKIDSVSLLNGNVVVHLPYPYSYPQRGGKLDNLAYITMNTKGWTIHSQSVESHLVTYWTAGNTGLIDLMYGGFSGDTLLPRLVRTVDTVTSNGQTHTTINDYALRTWDGATHSLVDVSGNGTAFEATDSSGWHASLPGATGSTQDTGLLVDRGGTQYSITGFLSGCSASPLLTNTGGGSHAPIVILDTGSVNRCNQASVTGVVTDANGNAYSVPASATTPGVDSMGRALSLFGLPPGAATSTSDSSGCSTGLPFAGANLLSYPSVNVNNQQLKICFGSLTAQTNFGIAGITEFPDSSSLGGKAPGGPFITTMILPDGETWTLSYDSYGNIVQIALPWGGSISYQYATVQFPQLGTNAPPASRAVVQRTLNDNQGHSYVWTYQWMTSQSNPGSTNGTYTNVVIDPSGNDTIYVFTNLGSSFYETRTQSYQGSFSSGRLLQQIDTTYQAQSVGSLNTSFGITALPVRVQNTLFPSGKVSVVEKSYDSGISIPTGNCSPCSPTSSFGNVLTEKVYDWGQGQAGPLLREIDTTYQWQLDNRYLNAHMLDLLASVVTKDSSGNRVAETDYTYDESQYLTASNITTQHGAPPNSVRGNLTTVSHWLNPGNTFITSHTNWYDTGEVYQQTDPLGHTTTHSYDPFYVGAYSTSTQNALGQTVSATYDFTSGLLNSFTNANATSQASGNTPGDSAHTTNYAYDFMERMTSATLPPDSSGNQPQTTFNYPNLTTVERLHKITATLTDDAFSYFDGQGRAIQSKHLLPGGSNALVDTVYDGLDHVASVTNPYFYNSDLTYGVSQNQYDALGRLLQTTRQDGSISTVSYSDNCTTTTDEAGKQRRACTDALGRLIEVDEPGVVAGHTLNNSLAMQSDGNLVVYDPSNQPLWSTGTAGTNATGFEMQDDGNLVLYTFRWSAGTYTWPPASGPFSASACSIGINLNAPQTLPSGKCITSPKLQYELTMSADGNLLIYDRAHNVGTWGTATGGHPGAYAAMQTDGNFVVYSADGTQVLWSSGTNGTLAQRLEMSDDGRVIIYRSAWSSGTGQGVNTQVLPHPGCDLGTGTGQGGLIYAGQCFVSYTGRYQLLMQTDGNLVINDLGVTPAQTLWSTKTGLTPLSPGVALQTLYQWDALGNLICVEQHGDSPAGAHSDGTVAVGCSSYPNPTPNDTWRPRMFSYDSLSRLLTANNPESGLITYFYDANGNLTQKVMPTPNQTGAATHTVSYCYDALNRVTGKAYSWQNCQNGQVPQGTVAVSYRYDEGTNGKGHLTSVTDQAGSATYGYDILGRLSNEGRTIAGVTKNMSYTYNLDSSIATMAYPSGSVITYAPDAAGRIVSVKDIDGGIDYVTGATYNAPGMLTGSTYGKTGSFTGIVNQFSFNSRLQPVNLWSSSPTRTLMNLIYDFHVGNGDNGNVYAITNNRDISRNQTFAYDPLNRLISAQNAGTDCSQMLPDGHTEYWGNSYVYDAWGNLNQKQVTKCSAENLNTAVNANNRLQSYDYDSAGNMTRDNNGTNYVYDPENRIRSAAGFVYTYDADGNRVQKASTNINPATSTLYWYMTPGIVAESDLSGTLQSEYVFFDGERVARKDFSGSTTLVSYYFSDHLKTASVVTDAVGTPKSESDYYPWGGELQFSNGDSNHYKLTGKERDAETGLDYFGARHYSNGLGRFIIPDWSALPVPVPYADLTDPQSLNQYSYVRNIPTSKSDPDGHECPECPAVERVLEEVVESPLGKAIVEKGGQIIGGIGTGLAAGWAWSSGPVKDLAKYALEHPGKSAMQQDMDDLSGRSVKQALAQLQKDNQDSQTNANDKSTPAKGEDFSRSAKKEIDARDNDKCQGQGCGRDVKSTQNKKGVPTPPDQRQRHHILPKSQGGKGDPSNGKTLCPGCHKEEHRKMCEAREKEQGS